MAGSTTLTLLVLPALYMLVAARKAQEGEAHPQLLSLDEVQSQTPFSAVVSSGSATPPNGHLAHTKQQSAPEESAQDKVLEASERRSR